MSTMYSSLDLDRAIRALERAGEKIEDRVAGLAEDMDRDIYGLETKLNALDDKLDALIALVGRLGAELLMKEDAPP